MKNQKVSLIVPVYNCSTFLRKCLDSIINQTYKNIEILLINDGSTDDSLSICNEYSNNDNRIIVINKTNSGVSSTRNIGINKSTGEFIMFVDADDMLFPNSVEVLLKGIEDGNYDLVIGNYVLLNNDNTQSNHTVIINYEKSLLNFCIENTLWSTWGKIIRKNKIEKQFAEDIFVAEDILFWVTNKNIKRYKYIENECYMYRLNPFSTMRNKKVNERVMSEFEALKRIINEVDDNTKKYFINYYINRALSVKYKYKDERKIFKSYKKKIAEFIKKCYKDYFIKNKTSIIHKLILRIKILLIKL